MGIGANDSGTGVKVQGTCGACSERLPLMLTMSNCGEDAAMLAR